MPETVTPSWGRAGSPALLAALTLLILLAFSLRLHNLDSYSFWTDEGLTPLRSSYSIGEILSNRITIQEGVTRDTHPPLYYLTIHGSRRLLGDSDFAFRYPSLLASLLLVPLLFQFGRRLQGRVAGLGLAVALLAAINPLQIWYANEARMYSQFVLLSAAASYVLWRALSRPELPARALLKLMALYLLLAATAAYTHYTAAILIAGQSLFWIWLLWRRGQRKLLIGAGLTGLLLALPLLPLTVPRLFTGAEANYSYIPPLTMLLDVLHGFSLGLSSDGFEEIGVVVLTGGALLLLLLGFWAAGTWLKRAFLLVYLLAIVLGLMAGSLLKPMYQGVRHIIGGSPAFLLLVAWGAIFPWQRSGWWPLGNRDPTGTAASGLARFAWAAVGAFALAVALLGSAVAVDNLYHRPKFAKDDYRALVRYIESHAGERDIVVYNNAILLPVHAHYQTRSDVPATALPVYPRPAAGAETTLQELADSYDRIWFVIEPPADGRDDGRLVERWLESNLAEVDRHNFPARTTVAEVVAYDTGDTLVERLPQRSQALAVQWPGLPPLAGIRFDFGQPAALPVLWLDLFWEIDDGADVAALATEYRLRFVLQGEDRLEWASEVTAACKCEQVEWLPEAGELLRASYRLPLPVGTPPGAYELAVQPMIAPDGPFLAQPRPVATVTVAASASWPGQTAAAASPLSTLLFANGVRLLAVETPVPDVRPGHTLPLTLLWQTDAAAADLADLRYELDVIGADGQVLRSQSGQPGAAWLSSWPAGALIRELNGLYIRPGSEPGHYRLRWRLFDGQEAVPGRPVWRPWQSDSLFYGEIAVEAWPLIASPPPVDHQLQADFGSAIRLHGYNLAQEASGRWRLTLVWQALAVPDENYTVFVHVRDANGGELIDQRDNEPAGGLRPTRGWRQGEFVVDEYFFSIDAAGSDRGASAADPGAGSFDLYVGLYRAGTGERLPVTAGGLLQQDNQLRLSDNENAG